MEVFKTDNGHFLSESTWKEKINKENKQRKNLSGVTVFWIFFIKRNQMLSHLFAYGLMTLKMTFQMIKVKYLLLASTVSFLMINVLFSLISSFPSIIIRVGR